MNFILAANKSNVTLVMEYFRKLASLVWNDNYSKVKKDPTPTKKKKKQIEAVTDLKDKLFVE